MIFIGTTHKRVTIKGIDSHHINYVTISTVGGVVYSSIGHIIISFHKYSLVRRGTSIHSSDHLEHYKIKVDDRSIKFCVKQEIVTVEGIFIPLFIHNSFPRMHIEPFLGEK